MAACITDRLPIEILDSVVFQVVHSSDLLNLALTCSTFAKVILHDHLKYHTIAAAAPQIDVWQHLLDKPDLAACVRWLTIFSVAEPTLRLKLPLSPHVFQPIITWSTVNNTEIIQRVLQSMTGLVKLTLIDRRNSEGMALPDLASFVLPAVSAIRELRIPFFQHQPVPVTHPLWMVSSLTALDIPAARIGHNEWNSFCGLLTLCPALQILKLPSFVMDLERETFLPEDASPLFTFPYLKVLHVGTYFTTRDIFEDLAICLLDFVFANVSIEELQWLYERVPINSHVTLPNLCGLRNTHPHFIQLYLSNRPRKSIRVDSIDRVELPSRYSGHDLLQAIDPGALRHLGLWSLTRLSQLSYIANLFPELDSLSLPTHCLALKKIIQERRTLPQTVNRFVMRRALARRTDPDSFFLSIHDAMQFFPRLRAISCADTGDKSLNDICMPGHRTPCIRNERSYKDVKVYLRKTYPQLEFVNGHSLR